MSSQGQGRGGALALALVAGASYGVGGALSQIAKGFGLEVGHLVVGQSLAALVILGIMVAVRFRERMSAKTILQLFLLGMSSVFSSISYYIAIDLISVGAAVAIQFQYVWMAVVFQSIFERSLPGRWTVTAAALVIVGALFASGMAEEIMAGSLKMDPVGIFFALLCAVFYALFIYMNGRIATEHHPVPRTFFLVLGASVFTLAVFPFMGSGPFPEPGATIGGGAIMGVVMTVMPCLCIVFASSRLPGGLVAILTSSELPVAVLAGCLLLGESVTPLSIMGVVLILAAIVLSEGGGFLAARRRKPAE